MSLSCLSAAQTWASETLHHNVHFKIDPLHSKLSVKDTLKIQGSGELVFNLSPNYKTVRIIVDGKPTNFSRTDHEVVVILEKPGQHTVNLHYSGTNIPLLGEEGGFLDSDWLAHPQDQLATWSIQGEVPKGQKFVLPGELKSENDTAKRYQAHFENTAPAFPPVLITGPFKVGELMANGVRIRTYFHEELAKLSDQYLNDSARYIRVYSRQIGPFPYPGFAIISGPAPVGWGLPGMTYMGRRVLALPFIRFTSLPHEVLHNWWGNAVEVDYANGNWAEGLTTYQADHAMAEAAKKGGGQAKRLEWLRNFAALPADRDQPLTAFRSKIHDAAQVVGYGKTAFVFHMLKVQLGAKTFDNALQRFNRNFSGKMASWGDIQSSFEAESGQDLRQFFKSWIERTGAPDLHISHAKLGTDLTKVNFTLNQRQTGRSYALNLTALVKTVDGEERFSLNLVSQKQDFTLTAKAIILSLTIDPDLDIFRRLDSAETPPILRDITLDPQTQLISLGHNGFNDAAHALAARLLQARLRLLDPTRAKTLILAGPKKAIRTHIKLKGWAQVPQNIAELGDARAWTMLTDEDQTVLVIEAETTSALNALARILPHYKRRSYVVMENGKTIDKGTWPPKAGPLHVEF
ncbi:MAG: M1 family aminopeptidase [Magnetovibrio sp.]|nr:M1 family aminopeptidase [Magnetovibrio sp.]